LLVTKLSHNFRERFVATYVDKYVQRNIDLARQKRVSGVSSAKTLTLDPYPFPKAGSEVQSPKVVTTVEGRSPSLPSTPVKGSTSATSSVFNFETAAKSNLTIDTAENVAWRRA
jgi:hypothetical protein